MRVARKSQPCLSRWPEFPFVAKSLILDRLLTLHIQVKNLRTRVFTHMCTKDLYHQMVFILLLSCLYCSFDPSAFVDIFWGVS